MSERKKNILGFCCFVLIFGCAAIWLGYIFDQNEVNIPADSERIEFTQLIQNSPNSYSIRWTVLPNNQVVEKLLPRTSRDGQLGKTTKYADVPNGQSPWVLLERKKNKQNESHYTGNVEIHINSLEDIKSGGHWDHGKNGSGEIIIYD